MPTDSSNGSQERAPSGDSTDPITGSNGSNETDPTKLPGKSSTSTSSSGLYSRKAARAARDLDVDRKRQRRRKAAPADVPLRPHVPPPCPETISLSPPALTYKNIHAPGEYCQKIHKVLPDGEDFVLVIVGHVRRDSLRFQLLVPILVVLSNHTVCPADFLMAPPIHKRRSIGMLRLWVRKERLDALLALHNKYWLGRRGVYAMDDSIAEFMQTQLAHIRQRCLAAYPMSVEVANLRPTKHRRWVQQELAGPEPAPAPAPASASAPAPAPASAPTDQDAL